MSTGQLDQRLVRGGTSTPNVFLQDGVRPLFEFAAAPFSDRSISSNDGPVSVSSEVEPLLEFAARHVPLQDRLRPFRSGAGDNPLSLAPASICPAPNGGQSLLEFASMHGTSQDRCRPLRSGAGDNPLILDRGSPGAQRLEASCQQPRFTGSPTSMTPLRCPGVMDRSVQFQTLKVSPGNSNAERPLTTGQSLKRQSSHVSHPASPDNLDHWSGHGRNAEIVLPFQVVKEDFPSPPRGVSCSLGKSRQSTSSSAGKRKNMEVAAAPPTFLPTMPVSTAPPASLPAAHVPAPGLKIYALPESLTLPGHVPGSAHPVHETRKGTEIYTALVNTERALAVMTPSMIQRCLQVMFALEGRDSPTHYVSR